MGCATEGGRTHIAVPLDGLGGHALAGEVREELLADRLERSLELGAPRGFRLCGGHPCLPCVRGGGRWGRWLVWVGELTALSKERARICDLSARRGAIEIEIDADEMDVL